MAITPQIDQWLQEAGYEHHCFISYPRIQNDEMLECAKRVKESVERDLSYLVPTPQVFLDERSLTGGDIWDAVIRRALCRSVAMIALCSPMYYHPQHRWCGLEWAAMDKLSDLRLSGETFRTIIPVIVRSSKVLPKIVSQIQYIDISRVTIKGRRYYATEEYRTVIRTVVTRIEEVATAIARRLAITNCEEFQFPDVSAFVDEQTSTRGESFWSQRK